MTSVGKGSHQDAVIISSIWPMSSLGTGTWLSLHLQQQQEHSLFKSQKSFKENGED